jgi:hypothetical protein
LKIVKDKKKDKYNSKRVLETENDEVRYEINKNNYGK